MTDVAEIAKGRERCETCRFGGGFWRYIAPEPLPEPVERRALFGLLRWQDGPSLAQQEIYEHHSAMAKNMSPCRRFPESNPVAKSHWCGEYQPATLADAEG